MTVKDLMEEIEKSRSFGLDDVYLIVRPVPKGFPRGEFLSDTGRGVMRAYPINKILKWIDNHAQ